jgi:predicted DNA-binding protein (MmcQ/YjbR family)
MNIEDIRAFALSLPDVTEGFPFGETVLVFKANQKMFLLLPLDELETQFNVKCDPDKAIEWREEFPDAVLPGYHMNKKHWNTVIANGVVSNKLQKDMILHSYELVFGNRKKLKDKYQ